MWTKVLLLIAATFMLLSVAASNEPQENDVEKRHSLSDVVKMIKQVAKRVGRMESRHRYILRGRDGRDGLPGKSGKDGNVGAPGQRGTKGPKGNAGRDGARGPHGANGGGVVYVRWGKTTCPSGASLVYKGRVGGELYTHPGGGVNYLCLTEQPKYLNYLNGWQDSSRLYGAEYQVDTYANGRTLFGKTLHDHDVPCAVCHVTTRTSKLMIPGTYKCPAGWKREYYGYLMTAYYGHPHPKDYICVDKKAQSVPGTHANRNGALLYAVEGTCGSLPCHPYINGREVTCAVCTK